MDLSDPAAAKSWVDDAAAHMGGLDVLYNNAGAPVFAWFSEMTLEQWRSTMTNELDIIFIVTKAAWPYLCEGGGSIVNTGSIAAPGSRPGRYRRARRGEGRSARPDAAAGCQGAAHGVRANSISPGLIATPGTRAVTNEYREWLVSSVHLLHRVGESLDVALLALYLASDESSFVTGADFKVDAGSTAGRP